MPATSSKASPRPGGGGGGGVERPSISSPLRDDGLTLPSCDLRRKNAVGHLNFGSGSRICEASHQLSSRRTATRTQNSPPTGDVAQRPALLPPLLLALRATGTLDAPARAVVPAGVSPSRGGRRPRLSADARTGDWPAPDPGAAPTMPPADARRDPHGRRRLPRAERGHPRGRAPARVEDGSGAVGVREGWRGLVDGLIDAARAARRLGHPPARRHDPRHVADESRQGRRRRRPRARALRQAGSTRSSRSAARTRSGSRRGCTASTPSRSSACRRRSTTT